jgi:hypothetical protein
VLISVLLMMVVGLVFTCRFLNDVLYPYGPCDVPRRAVTTKDIVGEWWTVYNRQTVSDPVTGELTVIGDTLHLVKPDGNIMPLEERGCSADFPEAAWFNCSDLRGENYFLSGVETLKFWENGTYQQIFVSETFTYTSPINQWELVTTAGDSPKLKLHDGIYFPAGIVQAFSENNVSLRPQHSDGNLVPVSTRPSLLIVYPKDGFTFLSPRICSGELSLTQMIHQRYDADDWTVKNPVFSRRDD